MLYDTQLEIETREIIITTTGLITKNELRLNIHLMHNYCPFR